MPLLSEKKESKREHLKLTLKSDLISEVKKYCKFAQFESIDCFFSEAALYILTKDREWKKDQKTKKKSVSV